MTSIFLINLLYVVVALGVGFAALRAADEILNINFKNEVLETINSSGTGAGLYYGLRWLAVCVLIAQAFTG